MVQNWMQNQMKNTTFLDHFRDWSKTGPQNHMKNMTIGDQSEVVPKNCVFHVILQPVLYQSKSLDESKSK